MSHVEKEKKAYIVQDEDQDEGEDEDEDDDDEGQDDDVEESKVDERRQKIEQGKQNQREEEIAEKTKKDVGGMKQEQEDEEGRESDTNDGTSSNVLSTYQPPPLYPRHVGDAWEGGPSLDLNHVHYVSEQYERRAAAVTELRTRMKMKSRPGYEMRVKQELTPWLVFQKFSRKLFKGCPCIVPTIEETVWDGDIMGTALCISATKSPDSRDRMGQLMLSIAIQQKYDHLAKYLIGRGANLNLTDEVTHMCPLNHAIIMGDKPMVRLLIQQKAKVSIPDSDGLTPILWATIRGYVEVIAMLVKNGADIHHQDKYGWTALHIACFKGYVEVVDYLVSIVKVRQDLLDKNGFSAYLYAKIQNHDEVMRYLDTFEKGMLKKRRRKKKKRLPTNSEA